MAELFDKYSYLKTFHINMFFVMPIDDKKKWICENDKRKMKSES